MAPRSENLTVRLLDGSSSCEPERTVQEIAKADQATASSCTNNIAASLQSMCFPDITGLNRKDRALFTVCGDTVMVCGAYRKEKWWGDVMTGRRWIEFHAGPWVSSASHTSTTNATDVPAI